MADGSHPEHISSVLARVVVQQRAIALELEIEDRFRARPCSPDDYACDELYTCSQHQGRAEHVARVFDRYMRLVARRAP